MPNNKYCDSVCYTGTTIGAYNKVRCELVYNYCEAECKFVELRNV